MQTQVNVGGQKLLLTGRDAAAIEKKVKLLRRFGHQVSFDRQQFAKATAPYYARVMASGPFGPQIYQTRVRLVIDGASNLPKTLAAAQQRVATAGFRLVSWTVDTGQGRSRGRYIALIIGCVAPLV